MEARSTVARGMRRALPLLVTGLALVGLTSMPAAADQVVPIVAALQGQQGSVWRSDLKVTNPQSYSVSFDLIFTPRGQSQASSDPRRGYTVMAGETLFLEDVYHVGFPSGSGAARMLVKMRTNPEDGLPYQDPVIDVAVYNRAAGGGEFGQSPTVYPAEALEEATSSRRIPVGKASERTTLGVATGSDGATITWVAYDATGQEVARKANVVYGPDGFYQYYGSPDGLADLFGQTIPPNGSVESVIVAGSAVTSITVNNNTTNDSRWRDLVPFRSFAPVAHLIGVDYNFNGVPDNVDSDGNGVVDDIIPVSCSSRPWHGWLIADPPGTYTYKAERMPQGMVLTESTGQILYQPPCGDVDSQKNATFYLEGSSETLAVIWYVNP